MEAEQKTLTPISGTNTPKEEYRALPHNIDAEQGLLGALLINNETHEQIADFLKRDHFFEPLHGRIYEAINTLIISGKLASPITLKTYFENDEALKSVGGSQYLAKLAGSATTIINAKQYGQSIHDLAVRRHLIMIAEEMRDNAYEAEIDADSRKQIEEIESKLYQIAENDSLKTGFMDFAESLTTAIDMAGSAYKRDGHLSGLASNFRDLDKILGGLQPSDLLIVAGRPGMGKTAFATNIAFHVAEAHARAEREGNIKQHDDGRVEVLDGAVVGFFSLEMSAEQLATRIISEQARISSQNIRTGRISEQEYGELVNAGKTLQSLPLFIDHTGAINIATLTARARRLKRQHNLGLIVVDYIQLVRANMRMNDNRVHEISVITQGLKALAKELNIPVIAISQLSRQVENRDNKTPQLSDLRESGSIEQDADVVMFVYREAYYKENEKPQEGTEEFIQWQQDMDKLHGKAKLIIGKNRHGPTRSIDLAFEAQFTRFSDYIGDEYLPEAKD
ncbi:MAG: replicative DNA helicase [Parvibaculales bacterium]